MPRSVVLSAVLPGNISYAKGNPSGVTTRATTPWTQSPRRPRKCLKRSSLCGSRRSRQRYKVSSWTARASTSRRSARAVGDLAVGIAVTLDDRPGAMLFAVLAPGAALQEHNGQITSAGSFREGVGSPLHGVSTAAPKPSLRFQRVAGPVFAKSPKTSLFPPPVAEVGLGTEVV